MSQAAIGRDWDHVASLAADLHESHARLVDFVATVLAEGTWQAAHRRERRPRARLGRDYPAPTGAPLHLHLVDFTPPGATPLRR